MSKIRVNRNSLSELLKSLNVIPPKNPNYPILGCFKMEITNGALSITAGDGNNFCTSHVDCENVVVSEFDKFCVYANKLTNLISVLTNEFIEIEVSENNCKVIEGVNIYNIPTDPYVDYFMVSDDEANYTNVLVSNSFISKLNKAKNFTSSDELRQRLCSVYISANDVVATDAHKLYLCEYKDGNNIDKGVLLPKVSVSLICAIFKNSSDLEVSYNNKYIYVKSGGSILRAIMLNEEYVAYRAIIPASEPICRIKLNKQDFLAAIKKAQIFAPATTNVCSIKASDELLKFYVSNVDYGEEADIYLNYDVISGNPTDFNIGMNLNFLQMSVQNNDSNDVDISFFGNNKALVLRDSYDNYNECILVMPTVLQ